MPSLPNAALIEAVVVASTVANLTSTKPQAHNVLRPEGLAAPHADLPAQPPDGAGRVVIVVKDYLASRAPVELPRRRLGEAARQGVHLARRRCADSRWRGRWWWRRCWFARWLPGATRCKPWRRYEAHRVQTPSRCQRSTLAMTTGMSVRS